MDYSVMRAVWIIVKYTLPSESRYKHRAAILNNSNFNKAQPRLHPLPAAALRGKKLAIRTNEIA